MNNFLKKLESLRNKPGIIERGLQKEKMFRQGLDDKYREEANLTEGQMKNLDMNDPENQELFTPSYVKAGKLLGKGINKAKTGMSEFMGRLTNLRK